MFVNNTARIIGCLTAIGIVIMLYFFDGTALPAQIQWVVVIGAVAAILAFIVSPSITVIPYAWVRAKIRGAAASDLVASAIGLTIGLIISALLAIPLANLPSNW